MQSTHEYDDPTGYRRSARRLAERAHELRDEAAPVLDRLADRAGDVARHGADWVRHSGDQVRTQIVRASDRTVGYVREEPLRALLLAAAVGTVVIATMRLLSTRRERRDRELRYPRY